MSSPTAKNQTTARLLLSHRLRLGSQGRLTRSVAVISAVTGAVASTPQDKADPEMPARQAAHAVPGVLRPRRRRRVDLRAPEAERSVRGVQEGEEGGEGCNSGGGGEDGRGGKCSSAGSVHVPPPSATWWCPHSENTHYQLCYVIVPTTVPLELFPLLHRYQPDSASLRGHFGTPGPRNHPPALETEEKTPIGRPSPQPQLGTPRESLTSAASPPTTPAANDSAASPNTASTPPPPPRESVSATSTRKTRPPPKCPHGKRRTQCLSCFDVGDGGGSICPHRRRKDLCGVCKRARRAARAAKAAAAMVIDAGATHGGRSTGGEEPPVDGVTVTGSWAPERLIATGRTGRDLAPLVADGAAGALVVASDGGEREKGVDYVGVGRLRRHNHSTNGLYRIALVSGAAPGAATNTLAGTGRLGTTTPSSSPPPPPSSRRASARDPHSNTEPAMSHSRWWGQLHSPPTAP
ncbi:hypothetical protein DFJ73DRAFT_896889 [Zopfochytrium polystomum]|nr:hypothetical protein DFJ73DRAFT_896889 [Zopfochytrium polystomum]